MNNSIGTTWVMGLMVTFIFLFSAFLILAINYSDVFRLRNETLTILEKYEGYTGQSRLIIDNLLQTNAYKTKSDCEETEYGVTLLDGTSGSIGAEDAFYCIRRIDDNKAHEYYEIKLFYKFNLPVIGEILTFPITGETKDITFYDSLENDYIE